MMQQENAATDANYLRLIFANKVMSFTLSGEATFGGVAQSLAALPDWRCGDPIAIAVIMGSRVDRSAREDFGRIPDQGWRSLGDLATIASAAF
jgi:hypothetical protein